MLRILVIGAVLGALAAIVPMASSAADLSGESRTYLQFRESESGDKLLPIYEYLNFSVQNTGKAEISFHVGGWLRYDLRDDSFGKDKNSDLQYAYLSYRHKEANAVVTVGRIMVFEGVAAERVDGVYARTDLKKGFEVSAYAGASVLTNEGDDSGTNTIYGARAAHSKDGLYTIGLSYLKQEKNSTDFREEEGLDLWVRPTRSVEIMGRSAYNAQADGWMQHAYNILLGPFAKVRLNAELSRTNYEYYFDGTTNTAFIFTPGGTVDPKEKLDLAGLTASYPVTDKVNVSLDIKKYDYTIAGSANYFGASARYAPSKDMAAGLSLHRMDGATDRLSYDEYRLYGTKRYGKANVAVDLLQVKYQEAINGVSNASSATLAAGYDLSEKLMLGADLEYAKNPDFDKEVRVFLKLIYRFQAPLGKGKGV